ncbi:MAG: AMP-binding protein [Ignavibacteriales bacterium]|nr:AMP-binding protein [Ignavibacteriales bacterium]
MYNEINNRNEIVWDRWCRNADKNPDRDAIIHWVAGEEPFRWTFSNLIKTAESLSISLLENGIKRGDVCAIIIRHNKYLYPLYLAIDNVGAIPAILAYPNPRLHPDKFRQGIEGMSQRSGLDFILTEIELEPMIRPLVEKENSTIKGLFFPLEWNRERKLEGENHKKILEVHQSIKSTDPFLLQHSSGTTGLQKPVLLSHQAVLQHVEYYCESIKLNDEDKIVSWLPLYHDMGLIAAFHLPLAFGIPTIQIDTFEWVLIPSLLLEAISKEKGTVSWLPNFAYNLMADKILDEDLEGISLESWRLIINCSEPVRYESHQKFIKRFQQYGLKPQALSSCYAMAETTYAVTQTPPDVEPALLPVDRIELAKGKIKISKNGENARICVSSGKTIKGCEVRIVDETRNEVDEGIIGEIAIKSVSMFDGYRNYPDKTAEVLQNGWYYSGDYGFQNGDEFYIIGRKKDIIIVAGNNIYPEDIEDVVSKVEGIIPGRVIAFGEEDTEMGSEQISVIAETNKSNAAEQKKLKLEVIKAGMAIDVSIRNVYFVPPRWLIKSSAGKPSRKANKERILENAEEIKWS